MLKLLIAFGVSLIVAVIAGAIIVPALRRAKAGQFIRQNGPVWHMSKQGTPTMGGLIFIIGIVAAVLTVGFPAIRGGDWRALMILALSLLYGAIGFVDDFRKLKKKQNMGLTALQKFLLQLVAAIVFVLLLRELGYISPHLYIPFANVTVELPEIVYFILAAFIIVGTVNAVNITDGVDGLASGVSVPVAAFYALIAVAWSIESVGIFAAALAGALIGFLVYNFNPAKVFMGDTGSLFLGGTVCATAFALDIPLVLVPLGMVYIIETLSDIIQVVYFKATHGKRIFKMAPLHHHFEMCGWKEKKIFVVFTLASCIFALVAWLSVSGRYVI